MVKSKLPASWQVIGRALVDWWDGWFDLLGAVIVWFLAQFTIVLGPPATFGLYRVAYDLANGESTGIRGLIAAGRRYFAASWLWNAINLGVLLILFVNIRFYGQFTQDWRYALQIVMLILVVVWVVGQFYVLPIFHEQKDERVLPALRNGLLMAMATPLFSFPILLLALVIAVLSVILLLPIFLAVPAIIPLMGVRAVQNRLVAYGIRQPEKTPKEIEREASSRVEIPGRSKLMDDKEE